MKLHEEIPHIANLLSSPLATPSQRLMLADRLIDTAVNAVAFPEGLDADDPASAASYVAEILINPQSSRREKAAANLLAYCLNARQAGDFNGNAIRQIPLFLAEIAGFEVEAQRARVAKPRNRLNPIKEAIALILRNNPHLTVKQVGEEICSRGSIALPSGKLQLEWDIPNARYSYSFEKSGKNKHRQVVGAITESGFRQSFDAVRKATKPA